MLPHSLPSFSLSSRAHAPPSSFVIVGGSLSGLALAAGLARSCPGRDRVVLLSSPTPESRRLVSGCSLRQSALHHIAGLFGCSIPELVTQLTGGAGVFSRITMGVGRTGRDGAIRFGNVFDLHDTGSMSRPLGLSARHGLLLARLQQALETLQVPCFERKVSCPEEALAYATGAGARLVNATPSSSVLGGRTPAATGRFVVAAQAPCVVAPGGLRAPMIPGVAHTSMVGFADGVHVCFFTPFHDPLSPEAAWYGFMGRVVEGAVEDRREPAIAAVTANLERMAGTLGLSLHDPGETLGAAFLPVRHEAPLFDGGVLDAYRGFDSGAPGIAADGMLCMAAGASAFCQALEAGDQAPERRVARALARVRWENRLTQLFLTRVPLGLIAAVARLHPGFLARQYAPGWLAPAG